MDYAGTKEIIAQTKILNSEDAKFIDENISIIQDNWEKRQVFRTETEARVSVLNDIKFPTIASKYWQSIREQAVFYENLVVLSFDYRRNLIKQDKITLKIEKAKSDTTDLGALKLKGLEIDFEEAQFRQINMQQVACDRMREIKMWHNIMQECVETDPNFDTTDVNTHQMVSYGERFKLQHANMGNASPSEQANLVGQLETTQRHLEGKAVLPPPEQKKRLTAEHTNVVQGIRAAYSYAG